MKKKMMLLLVVLVISLFVGCNSSAASTPTDPPSPPESVTRSNIAPVTEHSLEPTTTATYLEVPTTSDSKGPEEVLWGDVRINSSTIPEGLELPYWDCSVRDNAEMLTIHIVKWCESVSPAPFNIMTMDGHHFVSYDAGSQTVEVWPYADADIQEAIRLAEEDPYVRRVGQRIIDGGLAWSEVVKDPGYWAESSLWGIRVGWYFDGSQGYRIVDRVYGDKHRLFVANDAEAFYDEIG